MKLLCPSFFVFLFLVLACTPTSPSLDKVVVDSIDSLPEKLWQLVLKDIPDATPEEWYSESDSATVILFFNDTGRGNASFDAAGTLVKSELIMITDDLPKPLLAQIEKLHPDGKINTSTLQNLRGVKSYYVELSEGQTYYSYSFDSLFAISSQKQQQLGEQDVDEILDGGYESVTDSL